MRQRFVNALVTGALLAAALPMSVHAGFSGTDVFLPSVGARPGVAPSVWYTTVWVHNPNATAANITVYLLERQANLSPRTYTDTIPAGDTRRYDNAVKTLFNMEVFGALRITSNVKVIVGSRIYSQSGTLDDSVGQFFAGVPASFAIGQGQSTELVGVWQTKPDGDSTFRYNFGFVETTGAATCTVQVQAKDYTGAVLGTKSYTVRQWEQVQKGFATEFPGINTDNARLTVAVTAGSGRVIAFGSQVAQGSQDPSTFEMAFADALLAENSPGGGITGVTAGAGLSGGGTTGNVTVSVATGGITSAMIQDGAVGTADLANAAVTKAKVSAPGGTSGQVLGTDGTSLVWQAPAAGGGLTGVTAGAGLTGGGSSGNVTVAVASGGITTSMLANSSVSSSKLGLPLSLSHSGSIAFNVEVTGTSNAIRGVSSGGTAVAGRGAGSGAGVYGVTNSSSGYGVWGKNESGGTGVYGESQSQIAVRGTGGPKGVLGEGTSWGVEGSNTNNSNYGALAGTNYGAYGKRASNNAEGALGYSNYGVWGNNGSGTHAGYFAGNVQVVGSLTKSSGTFMIDHPLDPEERYLYHSFVESPDMKNIYDGVVVTDDQGWAEVTLPVYFQALNRDFRYQLTVIGRFAQAIVEEEIADNRFTIRTNLGNVKVSWQITGIRQDAWAIANPVVVEVAKPDDERGTYLHPEVWGQPEEKGLEYRQRTMEQ